MPKIAYVPKNFAKDSKAIIAKANEIIADYAAQRYVLAGMVREFVEGVRVDDAWEAAEAEEAEHRRLLGEVSSRWHHLTRNL